MSDDALLIEAARRGLLPATPATPAQPDDLFRQSGTYAAPAFDRGHIRSAVDELRKMGIGQPAAGSTSIPSALPTIGQLLDDGARSIASGVTFGLADEGSALANTALGAKSYGENLAAERQRDSEISPWVKYPGEIAGAVATGTGLGRAGVTLLNIAKPTIGNMALRGAIEGTGYGALSGFGHGEGTEDRLAKAGIGGTIGAATGGAVGAVAGKMAQRGAENAIPSTESLREAANKNYEASRAAGVLINPESFGGAVDSIETAARRAGINDRLHPDATSAIGYLRDLGSKPLRLEDVDSIRQILKDVADPRNKPGEQRIGKMMVDALDDYVGKLGPGDVLAGDPAKAVEHLATARDLWSRFRKSDLIDGIVEKAQNAASGYENGLRAGFRSLANDPKKMAQFSPEERDAITRVVRGGALENATKLVGKLAPTGVVSGGISAAVGNALGGAPGSIILPAIGAGARTAATAATGRSADAVSTLVRSGGAVPAAAIPGSPGLISGLIAGTAEPAPPIVSEGLLKLLAGRGSR